MRTLHLVLGLVVLAQQATAQTDTREAAVRRPRNANDPASDAAVATHREARPSPSPSASPAPAPGVADAVRQRLAEAASRTGTSIGASVHDGVVTLTGTVPSLRAADEAARIARETRGVRAVVEQLEVPRSNRTDEQIKADLTDAFLFDPVTESYEIHPSVTDGVATLTGTVHSYAEKEVAREVARSVRGVRRVKNMLQVAYRTSRNSMEIQAEVRRRLATDALLQGQRVDAVVVSGGRVRLSGKVAGLAEKHRAERLAWVMNVTGVDADGLLVDPSLPRRSVPALSDREIKSALTDALVADPRVLSVNPQIRVKDGVVTLTGRVLTRDALRAAERDARFTAGVRDVVNLLSVQAKRRPDAAIVADVKKALAREIWLEDDAIAVSAQDGVVTLTGEVDGRIEYDLADSVASRARGVRSVVNLLGYKSTWWVIRPTYSVQVTVDPVRDEKIRQAIEWQMIWSPFVDADQVHTSVRGGIATLTGTVDSVSERQAAIVNAREGGAYSVVDHLHVR